MGKTVEESKNQTTNNVNTSVENKNVVQNTTKNTTNTIKKENNTVVNEVTNNTNKEKETKKEELTFKSPVDGEKIKDYAKDSLVYSETLQEWTTHLGIDIKADKTTVVKASADGKIKSIKNDPRYGLSIIVEHQNGYETLYANLLTSEFVEVGEEVKQGQSIGTVGNSGAFEIADTPHLHFEITKDGKNIDPNQVLK